MPTLKTTTLTSWKSRRVLNCYWKDFLEDFSNTTLVGFYPFQNWTRFSREDIWEIISMTPTRRHNHPTIFCQCNRSIACSVQNANTMQFGGYTRRRRYSIVHSVKNVLQNGVIGWFQCYMKHAWTCAFAVICAVTTWGNNPVPPQLFELHINPPSPALLKAGGSSLSPSWRWGIVLKTEVVSFYSLSVIAILQGFGRSERFYSWVVSVRDKERSFFSSATNAEFCGKGLHSLNSQAQAKVSSSWVFFPKFNCRCYIKSNPSADIFP